MIFVVLLLLLPYLGTPLCGRSAGRCSQTRFAASLESKFAITFQVNKAHKIQFRFSLLFCVLRLLLFFFQTAGSTVTFIYISGSQCLFTKKNAMCLPPELSRCSCDFLLSVTLSRSLSFSLTLLDSFYLLLSHSSISLPQSFSSTLHFAPSLSLLHLLLALPFG